MPDATVRGEPESDAVLDETFGTLLDEIGGDYLAEVLRSFATESKENIADVGVGIETADADRVRKAAHPLKGSSLTLGAGTLRRLSEEIEALGTERAMANAPAAIDALGVECERVHARLTAVYVGSAR